MSIPNHNGHNGALSMTAQAGHDARKTSGAVSDGQVIFKLGGNAELRGPIRRLEASRLVFDVYPTAPALRISQVFDSFQVVVEGRSLYFGRAVVSNLMNLGSVIACEVKLEAPPARETGAAPAGRPLNVAETYERFFLRWQRESRVLPEFKAVVCDLQGYLTGLKLVLEQVEASFNTGSRANRAELEQATAQSLTEPVLTCINTLRERLIAAADHIAPDLRVAHENLLRRQLHPLFLCAPFAYRAYQKPLGYAGDYEMMNMIHRNTFEGDTLYARLVHYWLVNQFPAVSVRNRVAQMKTKLVQETVRLAREKRPVRILNVGCGPAREVRQFIAECPFADLAEFTLIDFDQETLNFVNTSLQEAKARHGRRTTVNLVQMSVTKLLKGSAGRAYPVFAQPFDLVYCGGLFDYFSDENCRQFVEMFYQLLAPGGLVVVANMDDRVPFKHMQEYLLDWHLIYRDDRCMASLAPPSAPDWKLIVEPVGVNLFLEVRKPGRD